MYIKHTEIFSAVPGAGRVGMGGAAGVGGPAAVVVEYLAVTTAGCAVVCAGAIFSLLLVVVSTFGISVFVSMLVVLTEVTSLLGSPVVNAGLVVLGISWGGGPCVVKLGDGIGRFTEVVNGIGLVG